MSQNNSFYIPRYLKQNGTTIRYEETASWKEADVCFNVANYAYPAIHTHDDFYEIVIILSGSIIHKINGASYVMRRGDCCLIRPEDSHYFADAPGQPPQNCLSTNFTCRREFIEHALSIFGAECISDLHAIPQSLSFKSSNTMVSKIEKTCLYIQSPGVHPTDNNLMICKSIVMELLSACVLHHRTQTLNNYPDWLDDLVISLQNPDNFGMKITQIIDSISYSYSYIQKQFRHHMGTTIVAYWSGIKLSHAKELLVNSKLTILEISTRLGYETVSHLNFLFKKHYGISPSTYRKQNTNLAK